MCKIDAKVGAEVLKCRGGELLKEEVQRCRGAEVVQRMCRGAEVLKFRGAEAQRYRCSSKVQRSRGADVLLGCRCA